MQQQPENNLKPEVIISIIFKHRWLIIAPFCLALVIGIYLSFTTPKKYEASTMIMVEDQKVPDSIVQSIVSSDITSRLNTITQQVMSRTNIERIIDTYQLFAGPQYENMFLEDKVQTVRNQIDVDVESSRNSELSTFSISYQGEDPEKVKNIANTLATYFMDENQKVRESQATGTSNLLEERLKEMKQRLEEMEQELTEYRQKYRGELPEQYDANLSALERLSTELLSQQQALRETNNALALLEQQIAESQQNAAASMLGEGEEGETSDLASLQAQLEALRARYTENHPSVVRLKNMISKLEEQAENNKNDGTPDTGSRTITSGLTAAQESQLVTYKLEKQNLEAEIEDLKKQTALFERRVENTPRREEELRSIERNYNNVQNSYDSLYERYLETEMSLEMEKKQQGEQFRIIDKAVLPQKPFSPDINKLFLMSIAAGLGIGGGLVFLLEFMNKSFKSSDEAESFLGLPILATIPSIQHPKDRIFSRVNNALSVASVLFSFLLLAGFAVITLKGTDAAMEFVKQFM